MNKFIKFLRNTIGSKKSTEEHFPDYTCKGICHDDMRCVDLPGHEKVCTSEQFIIPPETLNFLKEEIKKQVDEKWKDQTTQTIKQVEENVSPVRRKSCCSYWR